MGPHREGPGSPAAEGSFWARAPARRAPGRRPQLPGPGQLPRPPPASQPSTQSAQNGRTALRGPVSGFSPMLDTSSTAPVHLGGSAPS